MLVKSGIELNSQDEDGYTALHYAAELGHKDIVSLLISLEKIDVELRNRLGWSAKEMATSNDIQKLFSNANNENQVGFFASLRSNRQIEKLLMKVNENYAKTNKQ
jgi:ankyrin repeat protein